MVLAARCGTQATARARSGEDRRDGSRGGTTSFFTRPRGQLRSLFAPDKDRSWPLGGSGASSTDPADGVTRPASASSSVDLPEPLGPTSATVDPPRTSRSTSATAVVTRGGALSGWEVRRTDSPRARTAGSAGEEAAAAKASETSTGTGSGCPGTQIPIAVSSAPRCARTVAGGPSATTEPSGPSTTMRSTRSTHGPSRCSTTTVVSPRARTTSPTTRRTDAALAGSSIAVGSSSSRTLGDMASAPASASRCCSPPERVSGLAPARCPSPTSSSAAATGATMASRGIPRFSSPNATSRAAVEATTPAPGS